MTLLKTLPIVLIVFISGCATQVNETAQPQGEEVTVPTETQPIEEAPAQPTEGTLQGEVAQQEISSIPPLPSTQEFTMETDDSGYYMNGQKITSISATRGNIVKITFNLRTQGIYPAGAEYRGCGTQSPSAPPEGTTSMQFTTSSSCTITAYWPASGVAKASMQVIVS